MVRKKLSKRSSATKPVKPQRPPATFRAFITRHPELGRAHESVARAVERAGPLDPKTLALVKIGICIGAGLESALRSHIRRAIEHGASPEEIEQSILLAMNTVGFPRTVAAWSWAQEERDRKRQGVPRHPRR